MSLLFSHTSTLPTPNNPIIHWSRKTHEKEFLIKTLAVNRKSLMLILAVALIGFTTQNIYGQTITVSTSKRLTEATLHKSVVTLTLRGGTYEQSTSAIKKALKVSGVKGIAIKPSEVKRVSNTKVKVQLIFSGDFDKHAILTFTLRAGAIAGYNGPALTVDVRVPAVKESLNVSTRSSLTEGNLHGNTVTLTLSGRQFVEDEWEIENALMVSGIRGVSIKSRGVDRVSDTKVKAQLAFSGNFDLSTTLTFTLDEDAIAGYNGFSLSEGVRVSAVKESLDASTTGYLTTTLTEENLNGSTIALTLSGRPFIENEWNLKNALTVSGIRGVSIESFGVDRVGDTQITVELAFSGNFNFGETLTFTISDDAIARYDGPSLTADISVSAVTESLDASTGTRWSSRLTEENLDGATITLTLDGRPLEQWHRGGGVMVSGIRGVTIQSSNVNHINRSDMTITLGFSGDFDTDATLTFTLDADAIEAYDGSSLTADVHVPAVKESLDASTTRSLTEENLDGSAIILTLDGRSYEQWTRGSVVSVSSIRGATIELSHLRRVSDSKVCVELEFSGDFDTDVTLTFTLDADGIENYDGPSLTADIRVSAVRE